MRVYIGGVEREFPARWYFTAPGAKRFPFPHGAEASVWLKNAEVNQAWGEVTPYPTDPTAEAIRGIDRGINPGYPGQCYKGDPQWFVDGMLPAHVLDGPPPPFDPCCMQGPLVGTGGLLLRGTAIPSQSGYIFDCLDCPLGASAVWRLTVAGCTGTCAGLNGNYRLLHDSPCVWADLRTTSLAYWGLDPHIPNSTWQIYLFDEVASGFAYYQDPIGGRKCASANTVPLVFTSAGGSAPATLTVVPE